MLAKIVSVSALLLFIPVTVTSELGCNSDRVEVYSNVVSNSELQRCAADFHDKLKWRAARLCKGPLGNWLFQSAVTGTSVPLHRGRPCHEHERARWFGTDRFKVPLNTVNFNHGLQEGHGGVPECGRRGCVAEGLSPCSSASSSPWSHSLYSLIQPLAARMLPPRDKRQFAPGHKRIRRSLVKPSPFGLTFRKCAQVDTAHEFPRVSIYLLVNSTANLTQLSINDTVSGLTLLDNDRKSLNFTCDSLSAGFYYLESYVAIIKGRNDEVLELPAYLTFYNASQNDIYLFGPVVANFTLRINATEKMYPNHGVHFAGFMGTFMLLLAVGLLVIHRMHFVTRRNALQQQNRGSIPNGDLDPEYAVCNISETSKEEAVFEDKMVDIMVLEEPQNMHQALENLDMSNLLRAASGLESRRVQIHKDVVAALVRGPRLREQLSCHAERRLLGMLHGQLMGMEGKLKEEHVARMAALAARCGVETREDMEAEHRRQAAHKGQAELLFRQAPQQVALEHSLLLEKLHELEQGRLRHSLLARHEEASARVQRQAVLQRRAELHKIFSEELEEAVRMGEMDRGVANDLLHAYFTCQDQLEEVLDVFLANQRSVLGERHAQRQFLAHSLQSLKSLMCEVFAKVSTQMENWFQEIKREAYVPEEQVESLLEKAKKDLVQVKQGLDEVLTRERSAIRCSLVKKRRELISDKLQEHKHKQKELSAMGRAWAEGTDLAPYLLRWRCLLTSQCLELGELINNLDEEAAADIRKAMMRAIHGALGEVKGIQPAAAAAVLGSRAACFLPQRDPVGVALAEAQERLHSEGKAAQRLLQATRDDLQRCLELELQEQQGLRNRARAFFQKLCASQLTLSEEELLHMKLAFQNRLSQMDRCLVLPRAQARCRLQAHLSQWRLERYREKGLQADGLHVDGKKVVYPTELLAFCKNIEDQLQIYEQEKEVESTAMKKVLEEMRLEWQEELQAQEESLAVSAAALYFQRAEKWTRAQETFGALISLQGLLLEELRSSGSLGLPEVAQSIRSHCRGLEEAELALQKERAEWEALATGDPEYDDIVEQTEHDRMFHVERDCRIAASLQEALRKCEQVARAVTDRLHNKDRRSQVMGDLQEQLELKGLYTHLDQELDFVAGLVKRSEGVSSSSLLEALWLLLPTSPEADVLSLVDILGPRQAAVAAERDRGWAGGTRASFLQRLRDDIIHRSAPPSPHGRERERILKKRRCLLEKLFSGPALVVSQKTDQTLVGEQSAEQSCGLATEKPVSMETSPCVTTDEGPTLGPAAETSSSVIQDSAFEALDTLHSDKVFVFQARPEMMDKERGEVVRKRKKRNFLNFKKGAVAPLDQIDSGTPESNPPAYISTKTGMKD